MFVQTARCVRGGVPGGERGGVGSVPSWLIWGAPAFRGGWGAVCLWFGSHIAGSFCPSRAGLGLPSHGCACLLPLFWEACRAAEQPQLAAGSRLWGLKAGCYFQKRSRSLISSLCMCKEVRTAPQLFIWESRAV